MNRKSNLKNGRSLSKIKNTFILYDTLFFKFCDWKNERSAINNHVMKAGIFFPILYICNTFIILEDDIKNLVASARLSYFQTHGQVFIKYIPTNEKLVQKMMKALRIPQWVYFKVLKFLPVCNTHTSHISLIVFFF